MNHKKAVSVALFALLFLIVEVSQARLIRSAGRSTLSRVYSTQIFHIENQYLNSIGIKEEHMAGGPFPAPGVIRSRGSINGDNNPIGAFPAGVGGCYRGYEQAEFDDLSDREDNGTASEADLARLAEITMQDPCTWEFDQGDMISTFGFFGMGMFGGDGLLDTGVNFDIDWVIDGVSYDGEINSGEAIVTDDGLIQPGSIFLNADIDLAPGEYSIFARATLSSDIGRFFGFSQNNPDDSIGFTGFGEICEDNPDFQEFDDYVNENGSDEGWVGEIPEPIICGHKNAYTDRSGAPSFDFDQRLVFQSDIELLRIVATNNDPVVDVSAPASISLFLLGLGGLANRRRSRRK